MKGVSMKAVIELIKNDPKKVFWYAVLAAVFTLLAVYVMPKLIIILLPFVLALWISKLCTPIVEFFKNKLHIPGELASLIVIISIISILGYLLFIVSATLLKELYELTLYMPELLHKNNIELSDTYISGLLVKLISYVPETLRGFADYITDNIREYIKSLSEPLARYIVNFAKGFAGKLPSVVIFLVSLVLASYFVMSDSKKVNSLLDRYIPQKVKGIYNRAVTASKQVFVYYIKSRLIIGVITFLILVTGFSIISVKSPSITAFFFCLADALPVVGLGGVMLPWALWCMITGAYKKGIGILIVYAVAVVIRRVTEPKIVSRQMGIHPLVTVFLMYAGYRLFSGFGLIFFPLIGTAVINMINSQKYTNIQNEVKS